MSRENRRRAMRRQVERLERRAAALGRLSQRFAWARLVAFFGGLLLTGAVFEGAGGWPAGLVAGGLALALALALFAGIVRRHRRVDDQIARYHLWAALRRACLARMDREWAAIPPAAALAPDPGHPFEVDLDLVGPASLHRLLDTCASHGGSQRLRAWLAAPVPDVAQTIHRQQATRELGPARRFRERLWLGARLAAHRPALAWPGAASTPPSLWEKWRGDDLAAWLARQAPAASLTPWVWGMGALAALNVALFALDRVGLAAPLWQITFLFYLALTFIHSRQTGTSFREAAMIRDALDQLILVFAQLEGAAYAGRPAVATIAAPFRDRADRPSAYLRRLSRLVTATGAGKNPALWLLLHAVFPWDLFFARRLEQVKAALRRQLPAWLDAWYELEALCALATFGYLNPEAVFPRLEDTPAPETGRPVLAATGLGHPLIPAERRVCNDFRLDAPGEIALITGSNMAGKSTFLRTVGLNLCLAYAGGPVIAGAWESGFVRLYSSVRVSDSVTDGISYFYAEVKRLKGLLVALRADHPLPLLFLIDEIFRGTNNRERLIGSRAYVRALTGQHGVGLISTHDLELVALADELPGVRNFHFRDAVDAGRMTFDYVLYPGPCPTTNALQIMRLEGLPV